MYSCSKRTDFRCRLNVTVGLDLVWCRCVCRLFHALGPATAIAIYFLNIRLWQRQIVMMKMINAKQIRGKAWQHGKWEMHAYRVLRRSPCIATRSLCELNSELCQRRRCRPMQMKHCVVALSSKHLYLPLLSSRRTKLATSWNKLEQELC